MSKVHIFNYSQVIPTKIGNTIKQFADESKLSPENIKTIASEKDRGERIIAKYKLDLISTEKFRKELNKLIEDAGGTVLDDGTFDNAWNAMCEVNGEILTKLYKLQEKYNFGIHIIGRTNKLHHDFIQQEIKEMGEQTPKISYTLSFKQKVLNNVILQEMVKSVYSKDTELIWHNNSSDQNNAADAVELLAAYYPDNHDI